MLTRGAIRVGEPACLGRVVWGTVGENCSPSMGGQDRTSGNSSEPAGRPSARGTMREIPDVGLSYSESLDPEIADEFLRAFEATPFTREAKPREDAPLAGVEWLLPTAVVLWLSEKYFGTMIQEAAKQHYPEIRAALQKLVRRTTGPKREVRAIAVVSASTPAKLGKGDPATFSIYSVLRSGQRVKFLFEHHLSEAAQAAALDAMHVLMGEHRSQPVGGRLLAEAQRAGVEGERLIVLRFVALAGEWRAWNPRAGRE
jgi:hypothetical protein